MGTPRRMVVVDDDSKVRLLLERAFRPPEFETHTFPNGAAALRRVAEIRPDCVVSDILMPSMDGESLLCGVRAVPGLERVPFIALSAVRSETRIRAVLAAGADAFLLKPFPLRELVEKVRALLERRSAAPPAPEKTSGHPLPSRPVVAAPPAEKAGVRRVEIGPADRGFGFGRFTRVEARGRSFVVLTEAVAEPRFTVTTVVTERGVPLRKIDSALPHPLAREEDRDTIRRQLDLQHEDVLRRLEDLVLVVSPRRVLWSDQSRSVEAGLLAWAVSAVAQLAETGAGTDETTRQLRLTHERALVEDDTLRVFHVTPFARVVVDPQHAGRIARRAVRAVAAWCRAFAVAALQVEADEIGVPVRQATRRYALELERMGFYDRLLRRAKE
jgi:DNA-binding response OmpR family regulator